MIQKMVLSRTLIDSFYIQVENRGEFNVIFVVEFVYKGKKETTKSQPIQPYYKSKICVPMSAPNVNVAINITSHGYARTAYKAFIPGNNNHCFYITGTFDDPLSMECAC